MERHRFAEREHVGGCTECGQSANAPIHNAPSVDLVPMGALEFADYARQLGAVAFDLQLTVPAFKARSRDDIETTRTITRYPAGPVVTVPNLRSRPAIETKRDMAEGVCESNRLHHDHPKRWMLLDRMELT